MKSGPPLVYAEVECKACIVDFDVEDNLDANSEWRCPNCGVVQRLGDVGQLCIDRGNGWEWQVHPQFAEWSRGELTGSLAPKTPTDSPT